MPGQLQFPGLQVHRQLLELIEDQVHWQWHWQCRGTICRGTCTVQERSQERSPGGEQRDRPNRTVLGHGAPSFPRGSCDCVVTGPVPPFPNFLFGWQRWKGAGTSQGAQNARAAGKVPDCGQRSERVGMKQQAIAFSLSL